MFLSAVCQACHGCDSMVVRFISSYAICAYHYLIQVWFPLWQWVFDSLPLTYSRSADFWRYSSFLWRIYVFVCSLSAISEWYMILSADCQLYQNDICFCLQSVSYIRTIYVFASSLSAISERYMFLSAVCQLYQNDICFCQQSVSYIRTIYVFVCRQKHISFWYSWQSADKNIYRSDIADRLLTKTYIILI
jgi:hypothetical protein